MQTQSGWDTGDNHFALLDPFPEIWTEILQRVPESDR